MFLFHQRVFGIGRSEIRYFRSTCLPLIETPRLSFLKLRPSCDGTKEPPLCPRSIIDTLQIADFDQRFRAATVHHPLSLASSYITKLSTTHLATTGPVAALPVPCAALPNAPPPNAPPDAPNAPPDAAPNDPLRCPKADCPNAPPPAVGAAVVPNAAAGVDVVPNADGVPNDEEPKAGCCGVVHELPVGMSVAV